MQDSEFLSVNKMLFEAKCKLYTKEMNPKPMHAQIFYSSWRYAEASWLLF